MLTLIFLLHATSVDAKSALVVARAVIDHQDESIRCWDVSYSNAIQSVSRVGTPTAKPVQQSQKYRELRQGESFRLESDVTLDHSTPTNVMLDLRTFDGEIYRGYDREENRGGFSSQGAEMSSLVQVLYLSTSTLGAMLKEHADDAEPRWVQSGNARLLAVSWMENSGYSRRTFYLDPAAAYQPRRFTIETEYPEGIYADGRLRGILAAETKEFLRRGEIALPGVLVVTHDETYPEERVVRSLTTETRITSLVINPELDDSAFTIEFPAGTEVYDKDQNRKYIVGQPGSERPINARPADAAPGVAGPAKELWADWRVWTGFSALCLGLLAWVKRRGLA